MKEITLRILIEKGIIDENQKIWVYKWVNGQNWVGMFRGFAHNLKDDSILDNENISIAEIQREDLKYLINNNFKNNYIGIYYN